MNKQEFLDCERTRLDKFKRYVLLPNYTKRIGLVLFVLSFALLIATEFFPERAETLIVAAKNIILISMLMIALAKEKIEDELVEKLRSQAFSFAFITGVIFSIFQPYVNYLVAAVVEPEKLVFEPIGDSVVYARDVPVFLSPLKTNKLK